MWARVGDLRVRFEDLAVGDEIAFGSRVVTREDVLHYADVSGDHNRLHQDDDFARSVGFDGIIGHGMLTMGYLTTGLVEWLGDASALVRMKVAFRAAVSTGETIVARGRVKALDPETRRATLEVSVTVERAGTVEYPIKRSEAEVQLA